MKLFWSQEACAGPLERTEVHVWAVRLDVDVIRLKELTSWLSRDECARAGRYARQILRHRFIASRGQLRELLARYMATGPSAIEFNYDNNGKPTLRGCQDNDIVTFSVSRAGGLALFAFARGVSLGVDLENVSAFPDMRGVAKMNFSEEEQRNLGCLSSDEYVEAFFRCWTRKEAYLKAIGTGLLHPLQSFDVEIREAAPPALLRVAGDPSAPRRWIIEHLTPASGYIGALAIQRRGMVIRCWRN